MDNIPPQIARRLIEIGMGSENVDEADKDLYFQQQFMSLLMSSALQFNVVNSFIAAQDARVDLDAHAEVASQSAFGGTGNVLLRIEGMQTLIDITGASQQPNVAPFFGDVDGVL